jgi:ABC-2 type transport system permease protein
VRRALRVYGPFATSRLSALLQYRTALAMTALGSATAVALQVFLWRAVADSAPGGRAGGFDGTELTTYVLVSQMLFLAHLNHVDEEISGDIYTGSIAVWVVKPVSYPLMRFVSSLPVVAVNVACVALPVSVVFAVWMPLTVPGPVNLVLFLVAAALSVVIAFGVNLLVGMAGFLTTNTWGLRNAKESVVAFLSGQLVPVSLMPHPLALLCAGLPFQGMAYTPLRLLLGRYRDGMDAAVVLAQQAAWALGLMGLSLLVWARVRRRMEVFGG